MRRAAKPKMEWNGMRLGMGTGMGIHSLRQTMGVVDEWIDRKMDVGTEPR